MSLRLATQVQQTRVLAAAAAAVVVFDAAWLRAPYLVVLAFPFLAVAWRYRQGRMATDIALVLWCVVYTIIGVSYMLNNGLHGPAEPGEATQMINPGDFAAVYIGTPLAVLLGIQAARHTLGRRRLTAEVSA